MARCLVQEGVAHAAALAHQNPQYPDNTADRLRAAAAELAVELHQRDVPLTVYPAGEVMLTPDLLADWQAGRLLSVGDHRRYLLVEMPHGLFLDVLPLVQALRAHGLRLVVAHAERYPDLLDDATLAADWVAAGCLLQVTALTLAEPPDAWTERRLKQWAVRGLVHVLGSDGHGLDRRRPLLASGFCRLARWVGRAQAERIASTWGTALLRGEPVVVPPPRGPARSWFHRLFGG